MKQDPDLKWPDIIESWESLTVGVMQLLKGTSIYLVGDSSEINEKIARELAIGEWFDEHPQYLAVQLFVGGDSYSGITVPLVTKKIVDGNKDGVKPFMNLKNAKKGCNETYLNVDPANTACIVALGNIKTCIKDLFHNDILEPKCVFATPDPGKEPAARRSLEEGPSDFLLSPLMIPNLWCRNGDRDMVVPFVGTMKWIKSLNLTVVNDWRPCSSTVKLQVKYSEYGYRLTYATVKGAGHTALEYYHRECYYMFDRWIHYYPV
ncbi:unnamed protein product [Camellia sinensis]